ncbi:HAD family hydrolase [Arthrobacter sp. Ld5]|uniref:HAD family hydrolase n=1 Tax=Arthrobacter sp. Ld5 TaxID=649152 RepID=UPI003EB7F19B
MARTDSPRRWYLFDYGNVISTPPTPSDWEVLAEAAGVDRLQDPGSAYWRYRIAYDAGALTSDEYWSLVRGSRAGPPRAAWLDALDASQWSHLNPETLDVLEDLEARGEHLAVLSNMPAAMAAQFADASWTRLFRHLFFSSSLRLVKPSPAIFERVLAELRTAPWQVTFVDDSPANVAAARAVGLHGLLFDPSEDLWRLLAEGLAVSPASQD